MELKCSYICLNCLKIVCNINMIILELILLMRPSPCDQVATDALTEMERAMKRDNIKVNDRQLACARINSEEGQNYLKV